jgi:ankyrin repeat protein
MQITQDMLESPKKIQTEILAKGGSVNQRLKYGVSLLSAASKAGYEESVRYLLAQGAAVDVEDENGQAALYYAVVENHLNIAKLLLTSNANTNIRGRGGQPLVFAAINNKNEELAILIIKKNKLQNGKLKNWFFKNLQEDDIEKMVCFAQDFKSISQRYQHSDINAFAREVESLTHQYSFEWLTTVRVAVKNELWEVVRLAIENSEFSKQDAGRFMGVLITHTDKSNVEAAVRKLIECGADINAQNFAGDTPLIIAVKEKNVAVVQCLLEQPDVNVFHENNDGQTAEYIAASLDCDAITQLLIEHTNENGLNYQP